MFSKKQQELILTGIELGKELRNVEYKASVSWNDDNAKQKILKSMLAMTNIRDGGSVIIGVEQKKGGTFELSGMTQDDFDSFNYETISAVIAEFADPYITFSLSKDELDGRRIVLIDVEEFPDIPVVCKKDGSILRRGKLYTRGLRVPESVEVPSQTEMREILDIAIEKGLRKFFGRMSKVGIALKEPEKISDADLFEKQLRGVTK